MDHNTILLTRTLDAEETVKLREKLGELWPGERWTIVFGEMETDEPGAAVGPSEHKMDSIGWDPDCTTVTPVPRWET